MISNLIEIDLFNTQILIFVTTLLPKLKQFPPLTSCICHKFSNSKIKLVCPSLTISELRKR